MMKDSLSRRDFMVRAGITGGVLALSSRRAFGLGRRTPVNVLFIMTDQQRWDALSCAGNDIIETPNIDRLAHEGVYFENAMSSCPVCVPVRAVILTGHSIVKCGFCFNRMGIHTR